MTVSDNKVSITTSQPLRKILVWCKLREENKTIYEKQFDIADEINGLKK